MDNQSNDNIVIEPVIQPVIQPVQSTSVNNNQQFDLKKKKLSKSKKRKLLSLVLLMFFTLGLLVGGTYAWFVGLGTVKINSFDLLVTSGNQLKLSLTGNITDWHDSITITENTVSTAAYTGNKNHGVGTHGVVPISTVGHINTTTNRLDLFSKTSITPSLGGYRLLADKVDNSTSEQDGYFVFDLFIRNGSREDYIENYNFDDDEDVYLVKDNASHTTSSAIGQPISGTDDYGIANSVRVAFMQIGRIKANGYTPATAQQITCTNDSTRHITGLCNKGMDASDNGLGKTWNIWEPNNNKHHTQIVSLFNQICMQRQNTGTHDYTTTPCTQITTTSVLNTYSVNRQITSSITPSVDTYDGLNGYTSFDASHGLEYVDTLTDTEVNTTNNSTRQQVFRLAPNSITKVRVYVYLEGQDIDNYDIIYKGTKINVKFGFTKDRYELEENDGYVGSSSSGPVAFSTDSWETIKAAATNGTAQTTYHVGDTKCVHINGFSTTNNNGCNGDFKVRIANMSKPSECSGTEFSETACGFVVEFVDIITNHVMNSTPICNGSWPSSELRTYLNSDIYNTLPSALKDNIITTKVISGYGEKAVSANVYTYDYGSGPENNYVSNDKLYLLDGNELYDSSYSGTTATNYERQLDYYAQEGVAYDDGYDALLKYYNGSCEKWWLRSPPSNIYKRFTSVWSPPGVVAPSEADSLYGISPVFRLA